MILSDLRIALANARDRLRTAKEDHETMTAIREQAAIDRGATGKNAEERTRALLIALDRDDVYHESRDRLWDAEADVDQLLAQIAVAEDERDVEKLRVRDEANRALDRYANALLRLARQNPITTAIDAALPL